MFRVGQRVVRVSSNVVHIEAWRAYLKQHGGFSYPEIGDVVTISSIREYPRVTLLTFREHDNSHLIGIIVSRIEPGFGAQHFRPIVEHKTDISIFKKMLNPTSKEPAHG